MYTRVFPQQRNTVTVYIEDTPIEVEEGITASAAMALAGKDATRTTAVTKTPRGPFCQMGVCFECLMEIDGIPNQQGCLTVVREGMRIRQQKGVPSFDTKEQAE